MRKFRTAAALALCTVCLLQTAAPVLAAEDYPAPDVSGKTVEELIDAFRAEHGLTEDNFELSYYNTVTGARHKTGRADGRTSQTPPAGQSRRTA